MFLCVFLPQIKKINMVIMILIRGNLCLIFYLIVPSMTSGVRIPGFISPFDKTTLLFQIVAVVVTWARKGNSPIFDHLFMRVLYTKMS